MELHMRQFDGITFGMSAEGTPWAKRNFKKCIFFKELKPKNHIRKWYPCVHANDVMPLMGAAAWQVAEKYMETVQFDDDPREIYIIYDEEEKQ